MEQVGHKKVRKQAANQLVKFLLLCIVCVGCSISRSMIYNISKTGSTTDPIVFVEFEDENGLEIVLSAVKVNGEDIYRTEEKNSVQFNLEEGKYSFQGLAVGYLIDKTKKIKISKGDSLYLPMVMKMDTIPLVD